MVIVFIGCNTSTYNLSEQQESDLMNINSTLKQINFNGRIIIADKKTINSNGEQVCVEVPEKVFKISKNNKTTSIVVEPGFIYFIMDGFKGANYGLVYSSLSEDRLFGFYDIQLIRQKKLGSYWYFASSRLW